MFTIGLLSIMAVSSLLSDEYPLDDVVILEQETRIVFTSPNTVERRERIVSAPLTLGGREDFSDIRIPFYAPMQTIEIHSCRTTRRDGSIVDATSHAFVPVTPDGYGHAPDFVGFREMVISPPGIEEGSRTELIYSLIDSSAICPWWEQSIDIGQRHPVLSRKIRIENQLGLPLQWRLLPVEDVKPEKNGSTISWIFENLAAYPTGGLGPLSDTAVPRLLLTTCPSWENAVEWMREELITDRTFPEEAADSLHRALRSAVTLDDSLNSIEKIIDMFSEPIPIPGLQFRSPRSFARIMETGYANEWERLALRAAALRYCDINAIPTLIGAPIDQEIPPLLSVFDSFWFRINGCDQCWWGSPGIRRWPVRYGDYSVLYISEESGKFVREQGIGPMTGTLRSKIIAETGDSLSIRGEIRLSSAMVPPGTKMGEPVSWLPDRLKSLTDSLSTFNVSVSEIGLDGGSYTFTGGCHMGENTQINMAFQNFFGDDWVPPRSLATSAPPRMPVAVQLPVDLSMDIRIINHTSWSILLPDDASTEQSVGFYNCSVTEGGGEFRIRRRIRLDGGWYDERKMNELRMIRSIEGRNAAQNAFILR